mmetsp:Transcript_8261/g.17845  ORF Transcript_8261/g.17845 Transcript_8261/m.17845 type:complete len:223 (-) Transcript_8261:74-742(-)
MPNNHKIQIVFAPLPEEERDVERSAAKELALRTADNFRRTAASNNAACVVEISHLVDWEKEKFMESLSPISSKTETDQDDVIGGKNSVVVFLISCGPDGSVHRHVRKTTKWFKEQQQTIQPKEKSNLEIEDEQLDSTATTAIVALLGHSVCKTSAEQMADEVFSPGRRLAKSIQSFVVSASQSSTKVAGAHKFLFETQIELEPPEEKFDAWVQSWIDLLLRK